MLFSSIELYDIYKHSWFDLTVDIPFGYAEGHRMIVCLLKLQPDTVCIRNDKVHQNEWEYGNHGGGEEIGDKDPVEAHAAADDGNDLRTVSHPGGKIDHRNEGEQGTEQYGKIWNEIQVIIKYDPPGSGIVVYEIVYLWIHQVIHRQVYQDEMVVASEWATP